MSRTRWPRLALVLSLLGAMAGCGDDGPGTLTVTVDAPDALGAVSLEVVGPGVRGFEGMGNTQVFGGTVSAREGRHRVLAVDPTVAEALQFGILVDDVSAPWPTLRVVSAAGIDDEERLTSDVRITVARE